MEEALFIFVELKPKSFDTYIKARADVDKPGWFKASNRMLDDDDLYDFTAAETCAWFYIMSQASMQKSPRVRIILDKVDAMRRKFSRDDLQSAIAKLRSLGILLPECAAGAKPADVPPTLRPRNVDVTLGEDRMGGDRRGEDPPSPAGDQIQPEQFGIAPELAGNSKREQVLPSVPLETQKDWLAKYDTSWLKESLVRAIAHYTKDKPITEVDWPDRLARWFSMEKKPKLRPKPRPEKVKDPPTPWPTGLDNVLRDPRLADTLKKVKTV